MYEQPYNPYRNNIDIIKNYFKSPMVLVLGILSIVSMILSAVNSLLSTDLAKEITAAAADIFDKSSFSDSSAQEGAKQIANALRQVSSAGSSVLSVLSSVSIVGILSVVGIMLVYFMSRSSNPETAPTAGFTILYVLAILSLVGAIILTVSMCILIVALFILYAEFTRKPDLAFTFTVFNKPLKVDATLMLILAIAMIILFIILSFVTLFVTINRVRYISSVRKGMTSVELSRSGAKPYGIFCVIAAVFTGLSLISSISALFTNNLDVLREYGIVIKAKTTLPMVMSLIMNAVSLAILIIRSRLALGYAQYIDDKKYGYSEPPASTPYVPQGAGVSTQQNNPYSYLAQPSQQNQDVSIQEATFVNPYNDTQSAAEPTCPSCGAKVDPDAPFCGQCGSKL